jgi:hypothetical protein
MFRISSFDHVVSDTLVSSELALNVGIVCSVGKRTEDGMQLRWI